MRLTFVKLFPGTGNAAEKFFSLPRKGVKREARRICLASPKALWAKTVLSTELYHAPLYGEPRVLPGRNSFSTNVERFL
jgi:hypothetical protein